MASHSDIVKAIHVSVFFILLLNASIKLRFVLSCGSSAALTNYARVAVTIGIPPWLNRIRRCGDEDSREPICLLATSAWHNPRSNDSEKCQAMRRPAACYSRIPLVSNSLSMVFKTAILSIRPAIDLPAGAGADASRTAFFRVGAVGTSTRPNAGRRRLDL